jgi:hypothetical protein
MLQSKGLMTLCMTNYYFLNTNESIQEEDIRIREHIIAIKYREDIWWLCRWD